ncbi:putative conserved membrane protein [Synechococcus sp. NOUM97013]|nr:putative conserved membrane protein [Synechococcus sp. NOUM97013]
MAAVDKRIRHEYKRISNVLAVTGSCLSLVSSQRSMLPPCDGSRVIRAAERQTIPLDRVFKALAASALLGAAFLLAPEQPEQQASICQQHHSVEACRVW